MNYCKKIPFLACVLPLYFLTRLINLLAVPIFTDEAIYGYWAQVALHDPANRFISLEDGKQPLFIWIAAAFQRFIPDPLVALRLVSVFSGLGSLVGIYFLAKELFGEKVARVSSVLYIVLPFTLLYDRLGLFDSLLTMFCIWVVFLSIRMAKTPRLDLALLNGIALGLALITKSSANFFLYLLPLTLIIFNFQTKGKFRRLAMWLWFSAITFVVSEVVYNFLRVSPLFYMIDRKNNEFIRTFSEVLKNPLLHFWGNIDSILVWALQYNGPLIVVLFIVMFYAVVKKEKKIILLTAYIIAPFFAEAFFNQILYPRFSLFYFPFVIILIALGLNFLLTSRPKQKHLAWLVLLLLIIYPLVSSLRLLTNPPKSSIATADKNQYMNDWPSGNGVKQVVEILKKESKNQKVYVGTEGTFGLLPFALQIYFYGNENINIVGYWPVRDIPLQVLGATQSKKTYFIFNETQNLPDNPGNQRLKLIGKYQKGNGNSFMRLYEVTP